MPKPAATTVSAAAKKPANVVHKLKDKAAPDRTQAALAPVEKNQAAPYGPNRVNSDRAVNDAQAEVEALIVAQVATVAAAKRSLSLYS